MIAVLIPTYCFRTHYGILVCNDNTELGSSVFCGSHQRPFLKQDVKTASSFRSPPWTHASHMVLTNAGIHTAPSVPHNSSPGYRAQLWAQAPCSAGYCSSFWRAGGPFPGHVAGTRWLPGSFGLTPHLKVTGPAHGSREHVPHYSKLQVEVNEAHSIFGGDVHEDAKLS